jgi:hypothetical protein
MKSRKSLQLVIAAQNSQTATPSSSALTAWKRA